MTAQRSPTSCCRCNPAGLRRPGRGRGSSGSEPHARWRRPPLQLPGSAAQFLHLHSGTAGEVGEQALDKLCLAGAVASPGPVAGPSGMVQALGRWEQLQGKLQPPRGPVSRFCILLYLLAQSGNLRTGTTGFAQGLWIN